MATETNTPGSRPARRTIVKGAAWAIPAVAVASAAPAHAASAPEIIDWSSSSACKIPGNSHGDLCYDKGYVLWGHFENPTSSPITITITGITVGGVARCIVGLADVAVSCTAPLPSWTFTLQPDEEREIAIYTNSSTDSSSTTVTVFFNYAIGSNPEEAGSQSGDVGGSPWQGSCNHPCSNQKRRPMDACGTSCGTPDSVRTTAEEAETVVEPAVEAEAPTEETETVEEPAVEAPAVEETEPVEEQTVDTAEVTSAPDVSTDESTENN